MVFLSVGHAIQGNPRSVCVGSDPLRQPQRSKPMTSQGTAHGRFQRAIRDRHLRRATMAAHELEQVSLADALALTLLTAEVGDDRWPRAAARWLGRFIIESPAITIGEAGLAAAAMHELVAGA